MRSGVFGFPMPVVYSLFKRDGGLFIHYKLDSSDDFAGFDIFVILRCTKHTDYSGGSRVSLGRGRQPRWGEANIRRGCFLAKIYPKMKELGRIGGC